MDGRVRHALDHNQTIDLTTTGRRTGQPRRIEIYLHNLDGRLIISGIPRRGRTRAWLLNIAADPRVTIHVKGRQVHADLPASARIVTDPAERLELLQGVARNWDRDDVEVMLDHSPLIEVTIPGYGRDPQVA
jgi:deazaflavin-dependent oxidoreductase (nitroreductase family)